MTSPFLSVPAEVLNLIGSHLGSTSLIDLSRVSKHFELLDMRPIYQDITLSISPHFGEYPSISPHPVNSDEYAAWAKAEACVAEHRRRVHLREKVKRMMVDMGKKEEWESVRRLSFQHRAGSVHLMEAVLDYASPVLERLEITGVPEHPYEAEWLPASTKMFDVRLLPTHLIFPAMTHLRFGGRSFHINQIILDFCLLCPNLSHLEVEFDRYDDRHDPDHYNIALYTDYGSNVRPTRIVDIRFTWAEDAYEEDYGVPTLVDIVRCCPLLKRLRLGASELGMRAEDLMRALKELPHLDELEIAVTPERLRWLIDTDSIGFRTSRSLSLMQGRSEDMLYNIPLFPSLQRILLIPSSKSHTRYPTGPHPESPHIFSIIPSVASRLRLTPHLHALETMRPSGEAARPRLDPHTLPPGVSHLERTDGKTKSGTVTEIVGRVCSMRHENQELLRVRLLLQDLRAVPDIAKRYTLFWPPVGYRATPKGFNIEYRASNDAYHKESFEYGPDYIWSHLTDYKGLAVPLEVIKEMKEVEGEVEGGWDRRGVDVGEEAWAVLTKWHDGALAERANDKEESAVSGAWTVE